MALGTSVLTQVKWIGVRLEDHATHHPLPNSGSAVSFSNGVYQVSYDSIGQTIRAKVGDPAYICLMALPRDCTYRDDRGKIYTATELRTMESWTLPDSEHSCGGA
jgi:hypothetical protein